MRIRSAVLAITVSVSMMTPALARGFGGGGFRGGGGGFGGGGFRGGGGGFGGGGFRGGGAGFGGGGGRDWGGGGFHDFGGGGGGRDWGGGGFHDFGGGDGGFHDWGAGGGFGGRSSGDFGGGFDNVARPSDRPANFTGGWGNHGGDSGFSNRPGDGGNHPLQPQNGFGNFTNRGNHPLNPNHPTDGGWGHLSNWNERQNDFHKFDNNNWNSSSIRNSFNHFNNINVNNYGGWGHWGGWGGWGGRAWWGFPGGWYCPGWSAAFAWTSLGISTLTDFLGIAAMADTAGGGGGDNYPSVTNVTYEGPNVYVDGQSVGTTQSYYDETQQLATTGVQYADSQEQQSTATADTWKPLGVFALSQQGQTESNMLFQLAINKDGMIRGNYFNELTNEQSEVYGSTNKKTQMVSFQLGPNSSTIFDTRLNDLTKEDAPVLVHYGPNNTQQMMLVRLKQPKGLDTTASS